MRRAWILALAALLAGCGSSGGTKTQTVERTTTTEVVRSVGSGEFDAAGIYQRDAPSVVTITSVFDATSEGQGSGFVISDKGEIVTNAHVVTDGTGPALRKAHQVYVQFADGNQIGAKIVGYDPNADVGLLKIDPGDLRLRALPLGDSSRIAVGEPVAAIGSPFGEQQSLSAGIVSATNRQIKSLTGFDIGGAIQTDAAINRGNSGGPLLDSQGQVIGINSQIESSSGSGSGVGFAVPSNAVKHSVDQLRATGKVDYAFLGVSTQDVYPQLGQRFRLGTDRGAWVQQVTPGGPADKAGIRGGGTREVQFQVAPYNLGGDVIVAVAGRPVHNAADLAASLEPLRPGQETQIDIVRNGQRKTVTVQLGKRPQAAGP